MTFNFNTVSLFEQQMSFQDGFLPNFDVKYFFGILGGTGITPMLQLIRTVFRDPNDKTNLSLLFANFAIRR